MASTGRLIVITGPMFAGKTTRLLKEVQRASEDRKAILFKSGIDNRYSTAEVVTHDGSRMPAVNLGEGEACISTLRSAAKEHDVIAIDEAQFWQNTKGFADTVRIASDSRLVYVTTLNMDANGNSFRVSNELIAMADRVCFLEARCSKCDSKAGFTQYVVNGKESYVSGFVVAGSSLFEPRCRKHFVRPSPVQ